MSAGHFHVHGPHDHEIEHAAHSRDPFAGRIAVMTATFATIGAAFGYMAGATQNEALLHKNEAAIRKTEALSREADRLSSASMHVHHRWAQAMTLLQIAIALAAITLLTRNRYLNYGAIGVALAGIAVGGLAVLHV
jgi:hypothetical protein